jgi:DNA-binding CsgD family transcriptional regulator
MIVDEEDYIAHYGILRKSGRYPWGSGGNQTARNRAFLDYVAGLKSEGLTETEIAKGIGISTTDLRAVKSIAKNEVRAANISAAIKLSAKGTSNVEIGRKLGVTEATVRNLLKEDVADTQSTLISTANALRDAVDRDTYVDIGTGVEHYVGISKERLHTAVGILKEEGYTVHLVNGQQVGTGQDTKYKVLTPPGTTWVQAAQNVTKIRIPFVHTEDYGRSYIKTTEPLSVHPDRLKVVYDTDGGGKSDGMIYIREGVSDLSLGGKRYAQVRIKVGDGHYLKGMGIYKDGLPDGVDLEFHTNKSFTGNKLDALKQLEPDPDYPFKSVVRQLPGSAVNILREAGDWSTWSRSIAAQALSKQPPALAETQLDRVYKKRKQEYDEISALTNPAVKKLLLEKFADGTDAAAVHLKAAAMPRTGWHVIVPVNSLKESEVYAPNYRTGEKVVLIRYPHGGPFEIPELTVNNGNREARRLFGSHPPDAIAINHKVAGQLSGADFDGDAVLVVPNNSGKFKTKPPLQSLKGFDPQRAYKGYDGMPKMTEIRMQQEMGDISNLITDMTIRGASDTELAAAIRHSMVVIDAKKHELNYRQSAIDNGIVNLKRKYQGSGNAGASTLISRATADTHVPDFKPRPMSEGGPIDKATGERKYVLTGRTYTDKQGRVQTKTRKVPRMSVTSDARSLISEGDTRIERVYATHSNKLKALANQARLDYLAAAPKRKSTAASKVYASEVKSLTAKLMLAERNRPLERQAQVFANEAIKQKRQANPDLDKEQIRKIKFRELTNARARVGSSNEHRRITFTDSEWDAIQAGAISPNRLTQILLNADLDHVKARATPRVNPVMTPALQKRAEAMLASGATVGDVSKLLGIALSTLSTAVAREGG